MDLFAGILSRYPDRRSIHVSNEKYNGSNDTKVQMPLPIQQAPEGEH